MRKEHLVTYNQALKLRELGFHDPVGHYGFKAYSDSKKAFICEGIVSDWNKDRKTFVSIPTVYEVMDWLWRKYKIEMVQEIETMQNRRWLYRAKAWHYKEVRLYVNMIAKWEKISDPQLSLSSYAAYRMQISQVIKWILSHKSGEKSKKINLSKVKNESIC